MELKEKIMLIIVLIDSLQIIKEIISFWNHKLKLMVRKLMIMIIIIKKIKIIR